ncbi:MAG: pyrroline-5-carboxylate reductase [Clostridiales bacterium]|nr:pyrroline-5-carboxylate reductase [Clostridiales bacterium]
MDKVIGFIGSGNMGSAMIKGITRSGLVPARNIIASDPLEENCKKLSELYLINTTSNNLEVAKTADILFLAVKPNMYRTIINEIKGDIKDTCIVVSIAPGYKMDSLESFFEKDLKLVRAMPNTPALVGEGMSAICPNSHISKEDLYLVQEVFSSFSRVEIISEYMIDAVTAVSGSSPAYVFMMIEAMADGAVLGGIPRDKAYVFAAQALYGSAKMVLETGLHPGQLKDMVCSPGGSTIEAVSELEKKGFKGAIISAMEKAMDKSKSMGDNK